MIIKHFVKLSRSFHPGVIFIYDFIKKCSSLTQFRTRHYKMQLIFDFKGAQFAESLISCSFGVSSGFYFQ